MRIKKIAISAGHYPERPGAIATLSEGLVYVEHELAKKVVTLLKKELLQMNLQLEVQDFRGALKQKVEAVNRWNADLALEVHFNDSHDPAVKGTETLYYAGSFFGRTIAETIQHYLVKNLNTISRGAKVGWFQGQVGKSLYFLKNTHMPAVIAEVCFLNPDDIQKVIGIPESELWHEKVAKALAQGIEYYVLNPTNLPEDEEEIISDVFTEEAVTVTTEPAIIKIPEDELLQQLARFKDYRYRQLDSYSVLYPIPVKVADRMIQGISHTPRLDCSTFVESFIIGGLQRIWGEQLTLSEQQHRQLMIIGDENKPDGPIHAFVDLGLGSSYTKNVNDHYQPITKDKLKGELAWSVFQGWRESGSGHIFLIYKSKIVNDKPMHLILECNKAYNLDGVGVRNFGNFDSTRFAAILTGNIPISYWVNANYLLANYPELYGVKLDCILV